MKYNPRKPTVRTPLNLQPLSLMYSGVKPTITPTSAVWEADLGLDELTRALTLERRYAGFIRQTLLALETDPSVIGWRQEVLADLLNDPDLIAQIEVLLPRFASLRQSNPLLGQRQRNLLVEISERLAELDLYVTLVDDLHEGLSRAALQSPALLRLRENLEVVLQDENFQALKADLPRLRAPLEKITSLTIGINLDHNLKPISAVLMAINDHMIGEPFSFLERLIGASPDKMDETGIAPLRSVPRDGEARILDPLFQDLDRLLTQVAQPVARALNRYVRINTEALAALEYELAFYVGAAKLFRRLPCYCLPEVAPQQERVSAIDDLANIDLLLRGIDAVTSAVDFGVNGRIAVLTGPNSGGKTTYLRAVGLAQVLFQAGLGVPARRARISPVDTILTHFPALETQRQGRLAEEAVRLRGLFERMTADSVVLLNETFSSTTPSEALYLAQDILCGLRVIGVRAIYATHLTELADRIAEVEAAVEGDSSLVSLIAEVDHDQEGQTIRTFRIVRGQPLGRSYAQEIARQHGISLEQILAARRKP